MITIRLKGGMGNQMFQYAFAKGIAETLNTTVQIDCSLLLDRSRGKDYIYRDYDLCIFNVEEDFVMKPSFLKRIYRLKSTQLRKFVTKKALSGKKLVKEKHFHADVDLMKKPDDNSVYDGWWQSFKYFENVESKIRKEFSFKSPILSESKELLERINATNSICLNVRRTDFLTNPELNATNLDYFLRAAKKMTELIDDPHFFIFSDDVAWCKENLIFDSPLEVVEHDMKGEKFGNYMQLMIACKHYIIPNSSFAWWAVWLNQNKNRQVIAPKNWFNEGDYNTSDLIPAEWIRL